jgi:Bacterial Ig-like domain
MNLFKLNSRARPWLLTLMLCVLMAGCGGGGGQDPILGTGGVSGFPPTVISVTPVNNATGVSVSNPMITATFSEAMGPIGGASSFKISCAAPCIGPNGTVSLDSTGKIATFTLATGSALVPFTQYTATITGATNSTGLALASPYVWQFTTGALVAPTVTAVAPVNNASLPA